MSDKPRALNFFKHYHQLARFRFNPDQSGCKVLLHKTNIILNRDVIRSKAPRSK